MPRRRQGAAPPKAATPLPQPRRLGRRAYPAEYRAQLVELVRSGRSPESLQEDYEVTATTIRKWVRQAEIDDGARADGLSTTERAELADLRREVVKLREEREILKKFAAWSAQEANWTPPKRSGS